MKQICPKKCFPPRSLCLKTEVANAIFFAFLSFWSFEPMAVAQEKKHAHTNRLVDQTSPYLLQHAHNPVQWYPWGDEAFAKAKLENKPIFLSVGYSTCYWCHVMEVESFEDEEVAAVINEHFIAIKVDREERPDIDEQYMLATQLIAKRGGWPNSVWLTPDGKPWMAGTYFPKQGFIQVLLQLADVWKNRRDEVNQQADILTKATQQMSRPTMNEGIELTSQLTKQATDLLVARFDPSLGGFGGAPKFPPHGTLQLLIQQFRETGDKSLLKPISVTLDAMWLGGIHDHIGGGFHRYSTDAEWLLPHFEKMLYDNAQLVQAYVDGYQITGNMRYSEAVADIHGWVKREMTSPEGAFYSALDSGEVGKEGEAYVWPVNRLQGLLGAADAALFAEIYNFRPEGNFKEQSTGKRMETNIPHLKQSIETMAAKRGRSEQELAGSLAQMRNKMLVERQTWPQPRVDDKVLTSWNGLMIGSLACAGRVLHEPSYIESASRAADFILKKMVSDEVLLRTYRDGVAKIPGYLDDYAYFVHGLIELHRATGDPRWLDQATRLTKRMLSEFEDQDNGGFFFTTASHEDLMLRTKHLGGGGNMPNPNGVVVQVLIQLDELTGEPVYRQSTKRTLESLSGLLAGQPHGVEALLVASSQYLTKTKSESPKTVPPTEQSRRVNAVTIRISPTRWIAKPGDAITIKAVLEIDEGWHLYGENPESEFLLASTVTVDASEQVAIGKMKSPQAQSKLDPILQQTLSTYSGRIEFEVPLTIGSNALPGKIPLSIRVKTQACDKNRCLPPQSTSFALEIEVPSASSDKTP